MHNIVAIRRPASDVSVLETEEFRPQPPAPPVDRSDLFGRAVTTAFQDLTLDGILVVDHRNGVVSANHRLAVMWGFPLGALSMAKAHDLLQAMSAKLADATAFLDMVAHLQRHADHTSADELVLADGRRFEGHSAPLREEGRWLGRLWCFRDVTRRHQIDAALRDSEHQLAVALEAARMGSFEWNLITNRVIWSHGSERLFGFAPGTFGGTHEAFERCVHPDDLPALRTRVARSIVDRSLFAAEFRVLWPDGSERWIAGQGDFTFAADGRPLRLCGIGLDVTDRKRDEVRLRQSMETTVAALAATCEARDPYTAGHQRRVAELAVAIATELGLDERRVQAIRLASVLHDIGKIRIPTELLTSPRALTVAERQLLATHAEAGYDILKGIDFPWPIAEIVRQHHERLDGSGYPRRLTGDAICLEAQIVGVADMVEAMSADRPYRPGRGLGAALARLERGGGNEFAAVIVDACVGLFRRKQFAYTDDAARSAGTADEPGACRQTRDRACEVA